MVSIAVLGSDGFTLGFRLAGIKHIVLASENPLADIQKLRKSKEAGIVIVEQAVIDSIDPERRLEIENSVDPVFISVSQTAEQDSLRRLIKRSIGVDLWS